MNNVGMEDVTISKVKSLRCRYLKYFAACKHSGSFLGGKAMLTKRTLFIGRNLVLLFYLANNDINAIQLAVVRISRREFSSLFLGYAAI